MIHPLEHSVQVQSVADRVVVTARVGQDVAVISLSLAQAEEFAQLVSSAIAKVAIVVEGRSQRAAQVTRKDLRPEDNAEIWPELDQQPDAPAAQEEVRMPGYSDRPIEAEGAPCTSGRPAASLMNTSSSQNIQNVIMAVSDREGGPDAVSSGVSCDRRNQKMKMYCAAARTVGAIFIVALLATPVRALIEMLLRAMSVATSQMMAPPISWATTLAAVVISHCIVVSVMGWLSGRGECENRHRKSREPAHPTTQQEEA